MSGTSLPAVVLTGTIGVGKTTVAEQVSVLLHRDGLRHALLDLDWLAQLYPPPDPGDPFNLELVWRNLNALWPNFVAAGAECAVIAGTVESEQQLDRLRMALPNVDVTACLVTAQPETVQQRIRARDRGALLEDFLARTERLASEIEQARIHDFVVANDGTPEETAAGVVDHLGWLRS